MGPLSRIIRGFQGIPRTGTGKSWIQLRMKILLSMTRTEGKDQTNPAVAFGGNSYLVVWQDYRAELDDDVNSHLYANPVDLDGHVMAGQLPKDYNIRNGNPICLDPRYHAGAPGHSLGRKQLPGCLGT